MPFQKGPCFLEGLSRVLLSTRPQNGSLYCSQA